MKKGKSRIFFTRIIIVFLVQILIKIGDQTYENIFSTDWRSISFTAYFTIYWLIIWYLSSYINGKFRNYQKHISPGKKLPAYLPFIFHLFFGFTTSFFANYLYRIGDIYFYNMTDTWEMIPALNPELTLSLLMIYMMIFYFDGYFQSIINKKEDKIQYEKLKRENTLSKYLNLKAQIEPHFLFNSLSVLSSLIYTDKDLASGFVLKLSKILRYVIEKNELLTVPLKEEIDFVNDYLFLIQTRFENSIFIENNIEHKLIESAYIPPVSIQLLIENATKHNKFNSTEPLRIKIENNEEFLIISNNLKARSQEGNTRQGLNNLSKRYSFLSDKDVMIEKTSRDFIVYLPILKSNHNESYMQGLNYN